MLSASLFSGVQIISEVRGGGGGGYGEHLLLRQVILNVCLFCFEKAMSFFYYW